MSSRTLLSRPRTRLYDCNYNIGQSYYKPMMDHLDRKYSGRPTEMPNAYPATRPVNQEEQDLFRTRRAGSALIGDFEDPVVGSTPEVGRKPLSGAASAALREFDDIFENRPSARGERERGGAGLRASSLAANGAASNGYDIDDAIEEVRRARARRLEEADQDAEDSVSIRRRNLVAMKNEREQSLSDRALETVGLRKLDLGMDSDLSSSSTVIKRRVMRVTQDVEQSAAKDGADLTRWTKVNAGSPLALESASEAAAINRARQTRNRLQDLEAEMEDLAERSALRERRAAQLRSLVAEQSADRSEEDSSYRSVKSSLRSEKKTVTF